jgi:cation diffusion facilitator CzcD-associated flavoprotein CzcO
MPAGNAAGWRATCEDARGGSGAGQPITYDADFVIMSTGNFSRPSLPRTYKVRLQF